jgi:VIT1/CCC1 family predicted Fe2+/Mn2+ transporter
MSMAAGEYVSVSSQADTEAADLKRETGELTAHPAAEHAELAAIYQARGLEPTLAQEVARQLMTHDALQAHARDELGITEVHAARPIQAALTSAATFGGGAAAPLVLAAVTPGGFTVAAVAFGSLLFLAVLGVIGAEAGGAGVWKVAARVTFWGAVAMAVTAGIGRLVGTAV